MDIKYISSLPHRFAMTIDILAGFAALVASRAGTKQIAGDNNFWK